jgi:hypothetical protein
VVFQRLGALRGEGALDVFAEQVDTVLAVLDGARQRALPVVGDVGVGRIS